MEIKNHTLICENRQKLHITGVTKVLSSSKTEVECTIFDVATLIKGKDLHIEKLDLQSTTLEVVGEIDMIKYENNKKSFWKKVFK